MTVTKKSRSEIKREAVLCAAREAFLEFGVANTSMDKISAMAGVSKRTVYNHFSSKEALVMALLSCLWKSHEELDESFLHGELSLKEQLTELVKQQIALSSDPSYVELSRVAMGHFLFKPEELKQQVSNLDKKETNLYKWLMIQAENKLMALEVSEVETAMMQLHHLIKGSAYWPQLMGMSEVLNPAQGNELASQTVELFWAKYGNEEC
ncbi:TetR/AcrR family transcriptional regulator [Vibrio mexicanus]|uniref:TetR/AcrR family transcriptional regulator n=1 Tax=Vibrio mexicanus TaxID=1004326 RepID=UPI00063C4774|nr:TetR/AcrR family transcriptional regulator [Vibrio mexicanus]